MSITMHMQNNAYAYQYIRYYRYIAIDMYNNKAVCTHSKHDDQDDNKNEHIGITHQNFPNPDSSKLSTVKILHYTVCIHENILP